MYVIEKNNILFLGKILLGKEKEQIKTIISDEIGIFWMKGAPVSHIIKTFKLKENRTSEELESMPNYLKPNYNDYNLEKDYHLILKPKK